MQIFHSAKEYVFASCVYAIMALLQLFETSRRAGGKPTESYVVQDYLLGLATLCVAVYFVALVRETSDWIERAVIVLTLLMCVIAFAKLLARYGNRWAVIPYGSHALAVTQCIAAALAVVRTFAVVRHRSEADC